MELIHYCCVQIYICEFVHGHLCPKINEKIASRLRLKELTNGNNSFVLNSNVTNSVSVKWL